MRAELAVPQSEPLSATASTLDVAVGSVPPGTPLQPRVVERVDSHDGFDIVRLRFGLRNARIDIADVRASRSGFEANGLGF